MILALKILACLNLVTFLCATVVQNDRAAFLSCAAFSISSLLTASLILCHN